MDELAAEHGFAYEVHTADIDEKAIRAEDPEHLVAALSRAKAAAIRAKLEAAGCHSGLLLTCDQVGGKMALPSALADRVRHAVLRAATLRCLVPHLPCQHACLAGGGT